MVKGRTQNIGSWTFTVFRLGRLLSDVQKLSYAGRQASASPAAGQKEIRKAEQNRRIGGHLEKSSLR